MSSNQQHDLDERQKAIRVIDYLLKLATLRTTLLRDIEQYEKVLWVSTVPREQGCFTQAWECEEKSERDEWLEVQYRPEPKLPDVPSLCRDWADPSTLRNKSDRPKIRSTITRQISNPDWHDGSDQPEIIPCIERIEDHPEIQQEWDKYVECKWSSWKKEHDSWDKVHKAYSTLFAIHQSQLRLGEEYELVLGLGLLAWQTPSHQRVRRHLIVADAALDFDAGSGKFTVRPRAEGAKLRPELDMLDITEQPKGAEASAKDELLTSGDDDPWKKDCVERVLQAVVRSIDPQGEYDDSLKSNNTTASSKPIVEYAPALILRKRSAKGLTEALNRLKERIEQGEEIPSGFADLAEIPQQGASDGHITRQPANSAFDGEIFFPKPSNNEQRRIVEMMRSASGVLVQGPPGTGKSHTIANLICHLLATGQRVLITAKTPRALQVLKKLLPDELQPLCITLLGSGLEEQRSLESSVSGILLKDGQWNEAKAKGECTTLEKDLQTLREEKIGVDQRLRAIRESETHSQSIAEGDYRGTAARIAEAVNRDRANYGWLADSVSLDKTCPITPNALRSLLAALRQFTPAKRHELGLAWPEKLLTADNFGNIVINENRAAEEERSSSARADEELAELLARSKCPNIEAVRNTVSSFREVHGKIFAASHSWMNDAAHDVLGGNSILWHELHRVTQDVIEAIEEVVAVADDNRVEFPITADIKALYEDAKILKEHMASGGKLGWSVFRPKLVKERLYVLKTVRVAGRSCSTVEQLSILVDAMRVRAECAKAWNFWKGRNETVEGPYAIQLAALKSLRDALASVLTLEDSIAKCREAIGQCPGMSEPVWADEPQLERVVASCRLALARVQKGLATNEVEEIEAPLSRMAAKDNAHPVINKLLFAIRSRAVDNFAECMYTIRDLEKNRQRLHKVDNYLSNLRCLLPQFTQSLEQSCNEPYWDERIQGIGNAWRWAQARYWVEEYIRQEDVPALIQRARQIEEGVSRIVAKLAALYAWSFCFQRLTDDHRSHMTAWQQAMKRLGKGTGKHAAYHRRNAQKHLNKCREAVPAWVMPLHRVWDTMDPAPGMFDVIIVDEASQCGVEALPLFYLGKQIVIVGDDEQISPDAVGVDQNEVHALMQQHLNGFQFQSSFDVQSSLFDHGKLRFGTWRITLREHFRCMPEIIRFSNDLCYSSTPLIPLRQYGPDRLPPLDHVFVSNGYREGSASRTINRPEAEAIAEKILELCVDSQYEDKTMGVVVLQGEAQAALIEQLLLERLGAEEMERRRLICGNPYSFQGDERDVIFLSLVAASNQGIGSLTKEADKRRFNVAASRARDMMILFHSITCDDLNPSCLRRRLLDFFQNKGPQQIAGIDRNQLERSAAHDNRSVVKPPLPFDSWFEVDVALELLRRNFNVLAQHEVAGKRIDLVIEGGQARLAVECDGDHWHGPDRYEEDMQRQRQLERCGWEFSRVRESAFYANKADALSGLWRALKERDIFPNSTHGEPTSETTTKEDAVESNIDIEADRDNTTALPVVLSALQSK